MKSSGIGGQAVMEGVMMRNKGVYSVAVRKPDQKIEVKVEEYKGVGGGHKITKVPFIRGVFSFIDSLVLGMQVLDYSSKFYETDEDEKPSKFELLLEKWFGDKMEKVISTAVVVLSIIMAVVIFMLFPAFLGNLLDKVIKSKILVNFLEGIIRIIIFILYVWLISFMEEIKRTYMYHGAEHKCINCIEHGLPLTVENVRISSKEHKRCGTSFMLIVMVISVLMFMFIQTNTVWMRFLSRILLIPVIAGVSYEFLRLAGNSDSKLVDLLSRPGMLLQRLTTSEPDDSMIEVGIAAVEAVFDWKKYESEVFGLREEGLDEETVSGDEAVSDEEAAE